MAGLLTSLQRKLNPIRENLRPEYEATKAYYESISGATPENLNAKFEGGELNSKKFEEFVTKRGLPLYRQLVAAGNRGRANAHWSRQSAARMKVTALEREKLKPVIAMQKASELQAYTAQLKEQAANKLKKELASPKYAPPTTLPAARGTGLGGGRRRVSRTRKSKKSKRGTRKH
jgi:hypothetical protein